MPCERTPWSLLRCTLHVTVSRAIGCRFLSGVVVTSPTVITCSNGLTEEALWEGVLLPALLPACSLRSVFFSGRWPGPVGSFRSTAPHHNPPFLELATTSSPCQAMKLCEEASNVELHRSKCGGSTLSWADAGPLAFGSLDLNGLHTPGVRAL